jgi:hypothetical protein
VNEVQGFPPGAGSVSCYSLTWHGSFALACFDQADDVHHGPASIAGVQRVGPARMSGMFDDLVPNLLTDHLTGGSLKYDVKNHGNDAVHSYVHYVRDSVLFSSLRYPRKVKYEGIEGERCIAKLTRLEIPGDAVDAQQAVQKNPRQR